LRAVAAYEDLSLVQDYRHFLAAPGRHLRHLLSDGD
jgi:hypothetical protein